MTSRSEYTILEIQLRASLKRIEAMKELWRTYDFACKDCGKFQYEARVPSHRTVRDYTPDFCSGCGGIHISTREKS
jgi:acetone carboxylase gamma subunit